MPLPEQEAERLAALRRYNILDTPPEPAFDDLTSLASQLCGTPIALIAFVDDRRQWFKSKVGSDVAEAPREGGFCAQAILGDDVFQVEDATKDERFAGHPAVVGVSQWRFYAGMPVRSPDGYNIGTLCVADRQPRRLTLAQAEGLRILAHQVLTHLELRRHLVELERSLGEEQRAKEALRNSETFYATLVESLPQFIIRKDRQGRFTFANDKFCRVLGKSLPQILGKTDHDLYPAHLADKYHRDDLRVMATKVPVDTIEANQSPEGGSLFVHVIKTPLLDSAGEAVGIQGIFWDVTERRKIEEQLAYERDLLRSLLENVPDRIYFKDVASRFIRCSHSMARRLGLADPKDVVGKTDFDFHSPEAAQGYFQEEQRIVLTGRPLINKLQRSVDSEGKESWTTVSKVPVYNRHGTITGLIGIARDITKLKQAEEALEQARDVALEHARVKSEFLANMTHEIRTPMNAIVGMADLLLDTPLAPDQKEYVETLRNGIDALLHLISDILDFSKMEAGKLVLETIDFDLRHIIESTVEMLSERAHRKGVELACWIKPNVPTRLRGDPGRLRQVLTNLVSNAVKFTEQGEVVVSVDLVSETSTQLNLRVVVRDTGIGIPPKAIDAIFQAFTQADGSTTRKYGGTGLGLAISRQIVEAMGGRISAESTPGEGSTFFVDLAFGKQPVDPAASTDTASLPRLNARILVVDDNATARQILAQQLQQWGADVQVAVDGIEALALLRKAAQAGNPCRIALVDMQMPEMDGVALARAIKADLLTSSTRLILMNCMGCLMDANGRKAAGIEGCLIKPVKEARLWEAVSLVCTEDAAGQSGGFGSLLALTQVDPNAWLPGKDARILLAEDNLVNQRVAMKQLEKLGYTADAVVNGREVLAAVKRKPYDIILIDCQMPEMDGYETTAHLRKEEQEPGFGGRPPAYIIALTANALQADRDRGMAVGMNDYLTKPVRVSDLRKALQRASRQIRPASPVIDPPQEPVLDPAVLVSLKDLREPGQPDPVSELVQLYLKDAKPKVETLESCVTGRKAAELKAAAHSLKGSSNNLGARRLGALLQQMEVAGKAEDWDKARQVLPSIQEEFQKVQQALLAEIRA